MAALAAARRPRGVRSGCAQNAARRETGRVCGDRLRGPGARSGSGQPARKVQPHRKRADSEESRLGVHLFASVPGLRLHTTAAGGSLDGLSANRNGSEGKPQRFRVGGRIVG
jgi:hypothetical protein